MDIHGFNKFTLLDYPGLTGATLFTGGCNFRCPFCQNRSLVLNPNSQPLISEKKILEELEERFGFLEGVCITGGEPTINKDLPDFIAKLKGIGYKVKLDTNGYNPDMLQFLIDGELIDHVAMDVKNSLERYGETIGIENFNSLPIVKSINILLKNKISYEFRTTVAIGLHDDQSIDNIGKLIESAPKYYLQRYEISDDMVGKAFIEPTTEQMHHFANLVKQYVGTVEIRGI